MALRAKKAVKADKRLRLFLYGDWKGGKTYACCMFPQSYFIDTEGGATQDQYVDLLEASQSVYLHAGTYEEILTEVKALTTEKHEFRTLVIDSITMPYVQQVEIGEALKGDGFGKHTAFANTRMQRLWLLLNRLDMNVVVVSQAKPEYLKEPGSNQIEQTGRLVTDAWAKFPYLFDLVIELRLRGEQRVAEVRGSRLLEFPQGERFEFSYQVFEDRIGSVLGREAVEIPTIAEGDLVRLKALILDLSIAEVEVQRWLTKANVPELDDLPVDKAEKLLESLEKRVA